MSDSLNRLQLFPSSASNPASLAVSYSSDDAEETSIPDPKDPPFDPYVLLLSLHLCIMLSFGTLSISCGSGSRFEIFMDPDAGLR